MNDAADAAVTTICSVTLVASSVEDTENDVARVDTSNRSDNEEQKANEISEENRLRRCLTDG